MARHHSPPLHRPEQPSIRARDRAMSRVRRLTAVIGIASTTAAVGLGLAVASGTAHSGSADTPVAASTSSSSSSSSGSTSAADPTTTTTAPAATNKGATTTSGQT